MIIPIAVNDKIASLCGGRRCIVCDNSDYIVSFEFDSTWDKYETKTARFVYGGGHTDVVFNGNRCEVPVISNPGTVTIGVFSGNLSTSTGVKLTAIRSIRSSGGAPIPPTSAIYDQIMDKIAELGNIDPEKIAKAVQDYLAEHPLTAEDVGAVSEDELANAISTALAQAKESGEFDGAKGDPGADGADGITPHIGDNGNWYLGTTDTGKPSRGGKGAGMDVTGATVGQIVKISAVDDAGVPTAWLPVDMPSGGGRSEEWELVFKETIAADAQQYFRNVDSNGEPFELDEAFLIIQTMPFSEKTTLGGRAVGMRPTTRWGTDEITRISDGLEGGEQSTGICVYDTVHVKVVNNYQICLSVSRSHNSTNSFFSMLPNTTVGAHLGVQFKRDPQQLGQFGNPQGKITCVKIAGYTNPLMSAGSVVSLYKRKE